MRTDESHFLRQSLAGYHMFSYICDATKKTEAV
jgi:hypothetical protein